MNRKQLQETFTFPRGIDQSYVPRQEAVENTLYMMYESAGLEIPKVFFFKSPLALQMGLNYLYRKNRSAEMDNDFMKQYPTFSSASIFGQINTRSRNKRMWEFVSSSVAAAGARHITDNKSFLQNFGKYSHLADTIEEAVLDDVKKRLAVKGMEYHNSARHPHFKDIIWLLAHRQFMDNLTDDERHLFLVYHDLVKNGLMHAVLLDGAVLWCPLPTHLNVNDLKQLHCSDGPSLKWNDDYDLYFWRGIKVRKRLIEFPESITRLDVLEEHNPEIRNCIKERMGARKFASLFTLIEVDRDRDQDGVEQILWRTTHIDDLSRDYLYFAQLSEPKDLQAEFIEVPSGISNVWEAMAWVTGKEARKKASKLTV